MTDRRSKGDDLTGRRNGYALLKQELHSFFKKIWVVVILIGVTSVVGLVLAGFAIREIQSQRLDWCNGQNERNINTKAALESASSEDIDNASTQAAKDEIARRRDVTIGLIDAIQPPLDCADIVETGWKAYLP